MAQSWPFVARTAQLSTLVAGLRAGSPAGFVVVGAAGVGKSRLAREALRQLDGTGFLVVCANATGASSIPFGPFAHLLPTELPTDGSTNMLRWATGVLAARGPIILAVDDAHLLDASSAALVHHLVLHGRARLLATVRAGEAVPEPVLALWKDELVQRLELGPLSLPETVDLFEGALAGQVERATAYRLWRVTEGNPLFLRELVLAGEASGTLSASHGVWGWRGELALSTRLSDLIDARIGALDGAERDVVELAAFGEPLDLDLLVGLTSAAAVLRVERRGLIATDRDGPRLRVRLAHPLHGEVVRSRTGELGMRARLRDLAEALERAGTPGRDDALRLAVWRLDSGSACAPAVLATGCRLALAGHDVDLAVRLGRAAAAAGGDAEAVAKLGMALYFAGRHEEAEARLLPVAARPLDDRARALCGIARVFNLNWGQGRQAEADRVLDELIGGLAEPRWRQAVRIQRASLLFYQGRLPEALDEIAAARGTAPATARTAAHLAAVEALVHGHRGRTARAAAVTDAALAESGSWRDEIPNVLLTHHHARSAAAILAGDLDSAQRCVAAGQDLIYECGNLAVGVSTFAALRAQICRLRGRIGEAIRWGREAVVRIEGRSAVFAGLCYGELAHATALAGEISVAEEVLAEALRRSKPAMYAVDFAAELARAWVSAARGEVDEAIGYALATADAAGRRELYGYELFARHDVVRLGRADLVAPRLVELAGVVDGALAPLFARHAVAPNGAELEVVSEGFERLGMPLFAAEAAAQAAAAHHRAGRTRRARSAHSRAWLLAQQCEGTRTPALHALLFPRLTPRQWQIGRLAAEGLSNREIADRLMISTRTAANHLVAVYERLGVNDRGQLAALLPRTPGIE